MVTLRVGDTVTLCTSIRDFCSPSGNFYTVNDINCSSGVCNIDTTPFTCLPGNGQSVEFKWVSSPGFDIGDCRSSIILKNLGTATTDINGIASLQYTITQNDLDLYNPNNTSFDLMVCIIESPIRSKIRSFITSHSTDNIIIQPSIPSAYSHILEFRIRPWGWYTPNGAASDLLLKMNDINGWCLNIISGLTDWQYVNSDIITDGTDVLIQSKFKNLSLASATIRPQVVQLGAIIESIFMSIGYAVIIFLAVGYITGFKFFGVLEPSDKEKAPTYIPPPNDQLPGVKDTVGNQNNICFAGLPITPTCTDISTYATCLKSAHVGVYGTLKTIYPNFIEFQTTYNKYLDIYTNLAATCNPSVPGSTPADILQKIIDEQQKYIVQIEDDFKKLQILYEQSQCCIELPFLGCAINKGICDTARTVAYVIVGGIGVYLLYDTYTKVQPMLNQSSSKKK